MRRKRDTFKLGIAVITMFLLLVGSLWFIGGGGLFRKQHQVIIVRFAPGGTMPEISEGSFVTYFGQKIGIVLTTDIVVDIDPRDATITDQQFLEVQAALYEDLGLREDCQIVASGPPLGGMGTLEIISRGRSQNIIEASRPIYGQTSGFQAALDMITRELDETNPDGLISLLKTQLDSDNEGSVMVKIQKSLTDLNTLTGSLAREFELGEEDALLTNIHASVDLLKRALTQVTGLVEDNRPKIDGMLTSMEHASSRLDSGIISVLAEELELDEDQETTVLTKIHDSLSCLNQSLSDLNIVSAGAKEIVLLNQDRINELVENATTASLHLKQGVRDLSLHPWKVLFQPSTAEKRELHMLNVAREFADAAAHLDDSTSRLRGLLEVREGEIDPSDPQFTEILARLMDTVDKFTEAERALWAEIRIR